MNVAADQAQTPELDLVLLAGDGIGRPLIVDEARDSLSQEQKLIESRLLVSVIHRVVDSINQLYGVRITLFDRDLSLQKRVAIANYPSDLSDYYAYLIDEVLRQGGLALKLPTATARRDELEAVANSHLMSNSEWVKAQMSSPNDKLRRSFDFAFMTRGFPSLPGMENLPTEIPTLNVVSPMSVEDFFLGAETSVDGGISRSIYVNETMGRFADEVVKLMESTGSTEIILATKHTISPLDKKFTSALKVELKRRRVADKAIKSLLFDSFLPSILEGKHENAVVVALPDQAEMLRGLVEISGRSLPVRVEVADTRLPERMVFRVAKGSGYGETVDEDMEEEEGTLCETHTLIERDVSITAKKAQEYATERECKPCVVLIGGEANPADQKFIEYVNAAIGEGGYTTVTMSDLMKNLVLNPRDPNYAVLLTPNQIGDYITDFLPALHCGALKSAALGMGESTSFAFDDNGNSVAVLSDPSTGTAPMLVDPNNVKLSEGILPVGALLALANLLIQSPNLHGRSRDPVFNRVGNDLRMCVLKTILDFKSKGDSDYSVFDEKLFVLMCALHEGEEV